MCVYCWGGHVYTLHIMCIPSISCVYPPYSCVYPPYHVYTLHIMCIPLVYPPYHVYTLHIIHKLYERLWYCRINQNLLLSVLIWLATGPLQSQEAAAVNLFDLQYFVMFLSYLFHQPDIVECDNATLHDCHHDAMCTNTQGSFGCSCKSGYTGNGTYCTSKFCLRIL